MLSSACRPLLSGMASSSSSIAPSINSRLATQTRLASVQKAFKKSSGPVRKKKEKPSRDKVPGAFLPLPPAQVESLGGTTETELKNLPVLEKGIYPSKLLGKAIRFPKTNEALAKTFGLPRNVLVDFRLLSTPCSVSRKATESLARRLDLAAKGSSQNDRLIMTGSPGCGKSYLLLQAVTYCSVNDWIVMYIPRAHKLVDSSTSYFYDTRTQIYAQPTASNQILQRFWTMNKKTIESLRASRDIIHEKRKLVSMGDSLKGLFPIAKAEQHLSPAILTSVLEEIGKQEKFPVLLAIDEVQSLYCKTEYRNQHFEHIKSFHLSLPRLLMEYASGKKTFNRGAVIGAVSSSLTQYPVTLELKQALNLNQSQNISPYTKPVPGMLEYTQGLEAYSVPDKLEYDEAAAMFEIWMKDGALHSNATDELFLSKYMESSGNARDFVHGGILATQTS